MHNKSENDHLLGNRSGSMAIELISMPANIGTKHYILKGSSKIKRMRSRLVTRRSPVCLHSMSEKIWVGRQMRNSLLPHLPLRCPWTGNNPPAAPVELHSGQIEEKHDWVRQAAPWCEHVNLYICDAGSIREGDTDSDRSSSDEWPQMDSQVYFTICV